MSKLYSPDFSFHSQSDSAPRGMAQRGGGFFAERVSLVALMAAQLGDSRASWSVMQKGPARPVRAEQQPTLIDSLLCIKHFTSISDFTQLFTQ